MKPEITLLIIITIVVISYLFDQLLDYLNLKAQRNDIPPEIESFYDTEKYLKSLQYQKTQARFSFLTSGFSFLLSLAMLVFGGFGWIDGVLRPAIANEILLALIFFGVIMVVSDVLTIPFQWYSTFVIEEKFGFNKTTLKTFITDKLKGYLIGALVGGGLLSLLIYLVHTIGPGFWFWFGLIAAMFILFVNMFYASLILPSFNKLTPLADGDLKTAIEAYAQKVNFPLDNIFVMDGSKRSAKANAFFSGIGKKKKIVLYDTLINNHTTDELVAVLAHEVGHFKKKHIIWSYLISIAQVFFILFVLSKMIFTQNLSLALGGTQQAIHLNLIAFGILFSPISGITGLLMSLLSRKNEFEADAYARETFDGTALVNALKKLSVDTLSNLYPHPWYVFFHYSHPPLLQRLKALESDIKFPWLPTPLPYSKISIISIILLTLLSYVSLQIPPHIFWPATFLSYIFPIFIIACFILFVRAFIRKKRTVFIWLFLSILGIPCLMQSVQINLSKNTAGTIKVMSYNANLLRKPHVRGEFSTDIINWIISDTSSIKCFQEFNTNTAHPEFNIEEKLKEQGYESFLFKAYTDLHRKPGMAIFSKYPIVNSGILWQDQRTINAGMFTDLKIKGSIIRVYNVHLSSMNLKARPSGIFGKISYIYHQLKSGSIKRSKQLHFLLEHMKTSPYPYLVCGDFNETPYSYVYTSMRSELNNAFEKRGNGFGFTLNQKPYFLRIDHQFFSKGFKLQKYTVDRSITGSDHFPNYGYYLLP